MFVKLFFYVICLEICLNSLINLIKKTDLIFYEANYENLEQVYLSICLKINSSLFDCSNLVESKSEVCEKLKNYYKYIEDDREVKSPSQILTKYDELNLPDLVKFDSVVHQNFKYLYFKQLCFTYKLNLTIKDETNLLSSKLTNQFNISLKLFLHTESQIIPGKVVKLICDNFKKCNYFQFIASQYSKKKIESNCQNYSNVEFHFRKFERIDSKTSCFMECIKFKHRLDYLFYSKKDEKGLQFVKNQDHNRTVLQNIEQCKFKCSTSDCMIYFYHFSSINYFQKNYVEIKLRNQMYKAKDIFLMDTGTFWRKFIGLISLFFRFSCLSFVSKLNFDLSFYLKHPFKRSIASIILWSSLCFSLFYGYDHAHSIYNLYINQDTYSFFFIDALFKPANFSLALCKKIALDPNKNLLMYKEENRFFANESTIFKQKFDKIEKKLNLFLNRTFLRSSKETQKIEICFSFDIKIEEPRYRNILSLTSLIVNLTNFNFFYIGQYNKTLTTTSLKMKQCASIEYSEYRELNCLDYEKSNYGDCDSQTNCIDICYYQTFLKINKKLPINHSLIYLDYFEEKDLKLLYFDLVKKDNQTILENCKKEFHKKDCYLSNFTLNNELDEDQQVRDNLTIDLFFINVKKGKILNFNLFQMIRSFVTLYTILLGISWVKISNFIVNLVNLMNSPDEQFNFHNLILLISIVGFSFHSIYLYKEIFSNSLSTLTELKFEPTDYNEKIPGLVFCLEYSLKLKKNEFLTGNLLKERTSHINESYLFDEIIYYDSNLNKITWNSKDQKYKDNFRIELFFFLEYRCYQINYKMNRGHLKNYLVSTIIQIKFNPNIKHQNFLFISKDQDKDDFSKSFTFSFKEQITIEYSVFNVHFHDQYQILANPKLWFKSDLFRINDVTFYMNKLRDDFKINSNYSTKLIPLRENLFHLEIKDQLFEQYILQFISDQEKLGLLDLNYRRTIFDLRVYSFTLDQIGSIEINNIQYSFKTEITNNEGILLNYLNAIFLWFNFYVADLLDLISKLVSFLFIFRPKNLKKQFHKIKHKFESFFLAKSKRVVPISSLNNLHFSRTFR